MKRAGLVSILLGISSATWLACAVGTSHKVPTSTAAPRLREDTTITTPSGATVLAPKGWSLTRREDGVSLLDPEGALQATLLEIRDPDGMRAVATAWRRVQPTFARSFAHAPREQPPTDGWDSVVEVDYQTAAAEHRVVEAVVRRFRDVTYVVLVEGDLAVHARRAYELGSLVGSWHPHGMREESFAGRVPRPIDTAAANRLDAFIAEAQARLGVPGVAVAVIQSGRVVYERAFGVRTLGQPQPVTTRTLFMVGSITKPMTTLMQGALIDAGRFTWNTPVTKLLPTFAVGDPSLTERLAVWHMACACTGMPQQNLESIFQFAELSAEDRIASLRSMKPTTGLGETFQYSNLMVAAGGYAAAHAVAPSLSLAAAYEATMRQLVFAPIGMTSSTVSFPEGLAAEDRAWPHALAIDGVTRPIPPAIEGSIIGIAPAGGAWSNLHDMEQYVMTELAGGIAPNGTRVISPANVHERWRQRVRSRAQGGYGVGMDVGTYADLKAIGHTGGLFGFGTTMFMLPEQGLGIVILTNVRNGGDYEIFPFNEPVKRRILEELFDGKPLASMMVDLFVKTRRDLVAAALASIDRDPEPTWVQRFAGTYVNPSLGRVTITAAARGGTFDVGEWKSDFARKRDGDAATKLVLVDPPFAGGEPIIGGDQPHPTLIVETGQTKYVFERTGR
jgi:CubicO group peptidase (beta-lactamase class C family)